MPSTCAASAAALAFAVGLPASALAQQWTSTVLHPAGADASIIYALADGKQGGMVRPAGGSDRAAIWSGSASSIAYLDGGEVFAMSGPLQGGWWNDGPCYWYGTQESRVDLSCCGIGTGRIYAMAGMRQAGSINAGSWHAAVWAGGAGSMVDMHPPGAASSGVLAGDGTDWSGYINTAGPGAAANAAFWRGTSHEFISLHPAGAIHSMAYAGDAGQQGGYVCSGSMNHAALWTGSASSLVDLNPPGAWDSCVYAIRGGYQVGSVDGHAALWHGSTGSFVSLHAAAPAGYQTTEAYAIEIQGNVIRVGGYGFQSATGKIHAILWTGTTPCYANCDGSATAPLLNAQDFGCFIQKYGAGDSYANCDASSSPPILNVQDFTCFLQKFVAGCN